MVKIKKETNWNILLGKDWFNKLKAVNISTAFLTKIMYFLEQRYAFFNVYPSRRNVFRAFRITPYNKVKVVILGQSPYINGSSIGLAYANKEEVGTKIHPSLAAIESCIQRNVKDPYFMDYSLNNWAEQGVLLLNNSLTVEEGKPSSHSFMWKYFIKKVFDTLAVYNSGIIFCLWGESNFKYEKYIGKNNYTLKFEAPSKSVVKQENWDCPHFKEVNKILTDIKGKDEIIIW